MLSHHVCVRVLWVGVGGMHFCQPRWKRTQLVKVANERARESGRKCEKTRASEREHKFEHNCTGNVCTHTNTHTHAHRQKVVQAVAWFVIMSGWEIGLCKRERGNIFHNLLSIGVLSGLLGRGWCWWWSRRWIFKHQYSGKWQQRLDQAGPLSWEEWAGVLCLCWMTNCDNKWLNIKNTVFVKFNLSLCCINIWNRIEIKVQSLFLQKDNGKICKKKKTTTAGIIMIRSSELSRFPQDFEFVKIIIIINVYGKFKSMFLKIENFQ